MSLKRSVLFSFGAQVPAVFFSFLAGVCITRLLQEEGRGLFSVLQADIAILTLLLSFSMPSVLVYFLAKGAHPREQVIGFAASVLLVLAALVTAILLVLFSGVIDAGPFLPEEADAPFYLAYLAGSLLLTIAQALLSSIFLGLREFRVPNRMAVLSALANLLVYGTLFLMLREQGGDHVRVVLTAGVLVQFGLTLVWLLHYKAVVDIRPRFFRSGGLLRPAMSFSAMGYLADLLNQLNYRLDIWILGGLRGMGELGLYAVAVAVAQFFFMVPEPVARVLQPHLVSNDQQDLLVKFRLYSRLCITLVAVGGVVAAMLAGWLFPFVYGASFSGSTLAFQLLLPGIVFACTSKMLVLLVVRTGRIRYNVWASGAGLIITVVLDLLLIPRWGLLGASVASSCAYFTVMVVVAFVVFRRLHVPFGNYFLLMPSDVRQLLRSKD